MSQVTRDVLALGESASIKLLVTLILFVFLKLRKPSFLPRFFVKIFSKILLAICNIFDKIYKTNLSIIYNKKLRGRFYVIN